MLEKELRRPVEGWLFDNGYDVVHEFQLGHYADLIGCKFGERTGRKIPPLIYLVAVELKLGDIAGVIMQASNNWRFVNESYAAMPKNLIDRMLEKTLIKFHYAHVGLLSVDESSTVAVIIKPKINYGFQKRLWSRRITKENDNV